LRRERDERRFVTGELAAADAVLFFGQHDDRRPSGVSSASDANCAASASSRCVTPAPDELRRLPVAQGDRAGLVEQQRVDVASGLDRAPDIASTLCWTRRSMPAMPIAEISAPIVVGIRQRAAR
jgi:hypothetical protein